MEGAEELVESRVGLWASLYRLVGREGEHIGPIRPISVFFSGHFYSTVHISTRLESTKWAPGPARHEQAGQAYLGTIHPDLAIRWVVPCHVGPRAGEAIVHAGLGRHEPVWSASQGRSI